MSPEMIAAILSGLLLVAIVALALIRLLPKRLKHDKFTQKWRQLQILCRDEKTWAAAIIAADKLLNEALKKRKFKGGSMGERLVSANPKFTNKDDVWFAHNLVKKIMANPEKVQLKETDVKKVLIAFLQALRDVGALPSAESENNTKKASND